MSGWHRTRKPFAFYFGKGSACNVAKHKLIIEKKRVNISLYPACYLIVRGDQDSRANLMPIYGDLYQIKL